MMIMIRYDFTAVIMKIIMISVLFLQFQNAPIGIFRHNRIT